MGQGNRKVEPSDQEMPASARSIAVLFRVIRVIRGSPCYSLMLIAVMSEANQVSASIVLHSARALAGYAASELLEGTTSCPDGFDPGAFGNWHNLLTQSLEELATAISANRPTLYVEHVRWLRRLLQARGVEAAVLKSALECLVHVLQAELAPEPATAAVDLCQKALRSLDEPSDPESSTPLAADSVQGRLASNYLLALLEGDRNRAMRLVMDAAEAGHSVPELYLKVLLPAQEEAGRMWQEDEINVAEGHFATSTTKSIMSQLRVHAPGKPPNGKTLLAAAVTGNQHDVGLQAVAEFFEMDGWRVIPLGPDVPIRDLVEAVDFYQADLLGLSVSLRTQLGTSKADDSGRPPWRTRRTREDPRRRRRLGRCRRPRHPIRRRCLCCRPARSRTPRKHTRRTRPSAAGVRSPNKTWQRARARE